jgi:PAS domain S-box-containing protein
MSLGYPAIEAAGAQPHEVQLYGTDERFLAANVGRYIRDGLKRGEGVVVFAVLQHGEAFARAATGLGVDVETAIQRQQLMFADASETLAAFMADGQIDSARFESVIRQAVRNLRPLPEHTGGRAYGEMVGLLWTAGKFQQAVELEELWNRLLPSIGLRLFCAYPIDIFGADLHSSPVAAVLHTHTHILPTGEDGDLERALSRAFSDFAASDAGAWRAAPPPSASVSTVTIPSAETTILSLRSEASESAGQIVARARHYYQTEKRFRALIENSSDGILLLDASGKIRYASASAARVLGYAQQEVVGSIGFDRMHPDDQGHARYLFAKALDTPRSPVRFEARVHRSDGQWIWVDSTINNLLDEPEVNGVVWNYRDISERKATETALRHANEGLEQFAYAAAHDLQEPIRNIAIYSELLAKRYQDKLDEEANKFIGITVEGARRMQTLIHDLLAYTHSLSVAGEEEISTDADQVIEEVLSNLHTAIDDSGASVIYDPLPKLPVYRAHLVQLFQNLIGNALKYRGQQRPCVRVSVEESGGEFKIAIEDNGIGIAPDHRERIFGVFKRLHGRDIPGNGMGLAICNRIILHYRGRIWVESELGKGAKFVFTLPLPQRIEHG